MEIEGDDAHAEQNWSPDNQIIDRLSSFIPDCPNLIPIP